MTLSRGAIGNLVNRYRAVLRKCRMMNVFGSLAVAGMLVAGNAGFAGAEDPIIAPNSSISKHYDTNTTVLNTDQPQFSKELYAIGATGSQGALDISMEGDAALTVDASWRRDAADSNRDQLSAVYVGSGAQFSFTGTGLFRATGQGKVMEAVAFRNGANGPTGGTMRLTGAITGEAITEASENGSGYKAIGVKAENAGTIIFSGKSAWLKAMAHAGTADGVYARYGGVVDFQSEEVKVLSQSDTGSAASGISIEYSGGTITSSEQTALTVGVKAPASTATGISLSGASKGLVDLAGSLAVSVEGSPVRGIENDQGTLHVAKASSITGIGEGTFPSYGIWGRNGSSTELRGDVDVNMTSSTTVYGVYADSATVSLGSEGDVAILVQGSLGRGVAAFSGGNVELGSQGKEVSITAQNTGVEAGTSSTVSLNGKVKIDSGTGISLSSTTVDKFPSLLSNGSVSIISAGTGIVAKYAHAVFNELHIQAGTGIDVQSPGYIGSGNTDTVLDVNGPAEIVAQNTALQIVGASGSKSASSGFVGTFNDAASLRASNGNGVQLSASTHSGTTAARDCSVTFKGQTSIASEKGTGVVVNGPVASTAQDGASVVFEGATTIDAAKAIEIKKNNGKGASVTFAYNPTPINVPARAQDADSQVNGSVTGTGTLIKSGGGSLALNGDNSSFSGEFNMQGGRAFLGSGKGYFSGATVNLTGGTLVAPELRFSGGKLLVAGGTLETGTGQIFTSALNADGDMKDPGAVKLSDSNWKFDSGVIAFDDAKYNIVYAQTAAGLLGAGNVAADNASGSGSAKEITFTGTLVELPPGDPDSFETLQKAVLDTGIDSIKLGSDIVLSKRLQGTTPVTRSLTIDGNGHTISGAYPGLWFKGMDSGTVSIQNITFVGLKTSSGDRYEGPVSFGPAIFFDMGYFADNWKSTAKLIIGDGVQFRNTESVGDGAGGAVRTAHGIVEIGNNVSFINCTGGSGGGLYSESFTTIGDNVVFEGNKGRRGGALNVVDDYGGYLTDPNYASGARRVKYVHIGKNALFKNNSVELLGSGGNGGAIEVQSGELSIDDGATFTGNTSKSTGGAIAVCDWSPQLPAKAVLGSATFIQNSAGSYGGAIINEGDVRFNGPVSFVENTAGKIGGAVCNLNTLNMAAESAFSKNTAGVGGGLYNEGIASLGKASFIENAAADGGGAVFNVHQLTFADGAVFSGNSATDGGAVYNDFSADKDGNVVSDGSLTFNGGARFTGNTASGFGGAIYNTRAVTLNPGAGQEIVFSGNTDSTGSNAIFMGDGSSLDIMGDGKVVFDDALSSQSATPTLKKTGSGELLLNASMDGFLGTASFEGGLTSIAEKWLIKNLITVAGGKLKMSEFSFASQDAENAVTGGKLVLAGGILETGTGQIFANGLNAEGDARNPGSVKLNGDNWSFDSGLIAFDDAKYNLTYAQAAALLLGASNVGADASGSGSAKEITFTGTYVNIPNPGPISPYYYTGNKSDAASDGTVGGWLDNSGAPVTLANAITVKKEPGQASEYRFLSGVFDGSKASDTSSLIHDDSGVHVTSDGPLTIQNWGTELVPAHTSTVASTGEIVFGNNVSVLNNHSAGDGTKGGGALFSKASITFGDNAVLSGNATVLAAGGEGYGGGALFLDGKGEILLGKNALIEKNESCGYGGAIYSLGSVRLGEGAVIRGNKASYMGGALAVTGALSLGKNALVEDNQARQGGAIYAQNGTLALGSGTRLERNQADRGGAIYLQGGSGDSTTLDLMNSVFRENSASNGGALYLTGDGTLRIAAADTVFEGNSASYGGAIYNGFPMNEKGHSGSDGSLAFNGGARFTGNTASGLGGAIYNTRAVTLNPGAGQEIVFSGNTDSTGSNAIFMGDGSSLDITGDGKVVFDDALSSQSATPTLKKTGGGTLLFNASMDGFLGTAAFEDGRTEIAQKWLIKNTVTITGGRLKMPEFSFAAQGEGNNVAGGKLILAGGILETGTGQIFTNGLNAEGDNKDPGAVKLSGDNWSFDSGLIAFNDALYNLTYAQAAADSLGANNVEAGEGGGSTSAKEITFIGTGYVDPDPDPVPPVDPDPTPPAPEPKPDEDRTGKVSVDELNNNHANNIVLGNVTITTGTSSDSGKDFVVGASATDDKTDSISGSIGGKNIDLGSSGRNISVVGGHYLTLVGGSSDTPLVTAGGNPVNVHVGGTGEGASGVLNLGTPVMDSGGTLSGNIEIAAASTVNVRAGTHVITGEANETTGTADVAGMNNNGGTINIAEGAHLQSTIRQADGQTNVSGKLTSASVELSGGALNVSGAVDSSSVTASKGDIKVAGTLAADVLTTSSDVQINIGDQGSAGRVVARQVQLQGGRVFLDPAWKGNDALADASHGVFTFVNNEIDGLLTAGQNSLLVLGDTDTGWALDAFGRSSLQWGQNGVTAALAIRKPQTLNGTLGAVMVDGTKTSAPVLTPNTATFTDGSLLLVDGSGLNGAAALTSQGGTLNVDAGAKLLIDNITQGEYAITSGFSVSSVQGWNGDNLSTPDNLIGLVLGKDADGSMKVQATARRSSDVFRGLSLVNTMDAIWGKGLNDTESDSMGIRFLSRAVNENYLPKADTVHTVDGAAQIAVAGGVQGMAVAAADAPVRAIQDHASLLHMTATREGAVRKDGLNLWINALYGAEHARNFGAGSLDGGYNADFGGIVFGGDYAFGDFRVGMALNAGSGTARSRGDFNATKNDFDFWGVNLYGSWSRDQFNIVGDLGYSANKNEVKQDLPTTMQLGQLRGDVDTGVLTAGLRGEYRFETDWADVTPHVGVRYYNLRTDGFTSRIDEHDVFRVGRDTQEIWTFPIGVSFSRDFETSSGWKVKPRADLSVVPAAGDLKAKTKARVPGVAASDTIKARMMDSVSFDGTLGLEVQKDNISFGLDYGIRASEHKTGHGVNVSFTYKF